MNARIRPKVNYVHVTRCRFPDVLQITAAGWDGQIFRMSRDAYFGWRDSGEKWQEASTVYILYADHFDKKDGKYLYVGRTGDPIRRGNEHEVAKSDWTAALIFTSSGDWMSATHIETIEAKFISWAKSAGRYTVSNGTGGAAEPHSGGADQLLIDAYLAPVREVVEMAGVDIFLPNLRGIFKFKERHLRRSNHEISCQVRVVDASLGEFEILADGELRVRLEREGETHTPIRDQVSVLISSGQAKMDRELVRFLQDTRIYAKAGITSWELLGRSVRSWTDANRRTLHEAVGAPPVRVPPSGPLNPPAAPAPK